MLLGLTDQDEYLVPDITFVIQRADGHFLVLPYIMSLTLSAVGPHLGVVAEEWTRSPAHYLFPHPDQTSGCKIFGLLTNTPFPPDVVAVTYAIAIGKASFGQGGTEGLKLDGPSNAWAKLESWASERSIANDYFTSTPFLG
jgi:hypothetical protein